MPRTHLFVAQEVLLDSGDGGEDFGVLVAPVRLEVFDARLRLAMDEDLSDKLDLCDSWAWWAMVEWDLAYVQVVIMQVIHGNVRYRAEITIVMQDRSRYPLHWFAPRIYVTTPGDPPGKSEPSDPITDPRAWRLLRLPKSQRGAIGILTLFWQATKTFVVRCANNAYHLEVLE